MASGKWERIAWFLDFDLASVMARNRNARMRLIHAVYDERGKLIEQDIIADVGDTRQHPDVPRSKAG